MNLEKPRHGYEGMNNGGELYGNHSNTSQPISTKDRLQALRELREFIEQENLFAKQENETIKQDDINTELKEFIEQENLFAEQENETIKQGDINTELKEFIDLMDSTLEETRSSRIM